MGAGRKAAPWGSAGNTVPWCVRLAGGEKAGKRPEARARQAELVRTILLSPLGFLAN